ncbi:MAG TPA: PLP-dependent transferase [Cytophagaceae bacterium]|jgi:O-acetylhomoserine (thiol)-lyase
MKNIGRILKNPYNLGWDPRFISTLKINNSDFNGAEEFSNEQQHLNNPQTTFFEERIAALEGGISAVSVKSLSAARLLLIKNLLRGGDNIVTFNSFTLFHKEGNKYRRLGIDVRLSEEGTLSSFKDLVDAKTKLIYLETISSEYQNIPDFQKIITFAKERQIPVLVDNTAGAAGHIIRPIKLGANLVIESTAGLIGGGKQFFGAVIIEGGNYNWRNGKFPHLASPSIQYFDLKQGKLVAEKEINFSLTQFLKKKGNAIDNRFTIPAQPFVFIKELGKVPELVKKQSENTLDLALWLQDHEWVKTVEFVGLINSPNHFLALRYFRNSFGNSLSFSLRGSAEKFEVFLAKLNETNPQLFSFKYNPISSKIYLKIGTESIESIKEWLSAAFSTSLVSK